MTAKENLSQAYHIDRRINAKLEQVATLNALATKATATYSDMPKAPGKAHSRENIIVKIVDLQNTINADIDSLVDLKTDILRLIKTIPSVEHRTLLELRYICFEPWEKIASTMNYSLQHIFRLHSGALRSLDKFFKDESKCD